MQKIFTHKWLEPLDIAEYVQSREESCVFLYSGARYKHSGRFSYLAFAAEDSVQAADFVEFEQRLKTQKTEMLDSWFGYLGYELKNNLEKVFTETKDSFINLPALHMVKYNNVLRFDHQEKSIECFSKDEESLKNLLRDVVIKAEKPPQISNFASNMSKTEYLRKASKIIEEIYAGTIYQANLTRKFYGNISGDKFAVFRKLSEISPAPYSAFLKFGDKYIISSSPERFLRIETNGEIDTRPIKGSLAKGGQSEDLYNSTKDRAENLMIVDLMRNDLAKSAIAGSVKVESLFDVTSYRTIHHMSSTIKAQKKPELSNVDVVKNAFPAGSMTGAPKIKAIEICDQLEKQKRGVYAGAIGYFAGDGSADFSVVIRTIIIDNDRFELQVGGGIVADSSPEGEWQETLDKASAMAQSLGIAQDELEKL
jgi:aminodeoxychorismate synthase component I